MFVIMCALLIIIVYPINIPFFVNELIANFYTTGEGTFAKLFKSLSLTKLGAGRGQIIGKL